MKALSLTHPGLQNISFGDYQLTDLDENEVLS